MRLSVAVTLLSLLLAYPVFPISDAAGPGLTQLTFNTNNDFDPAVSSDGLKVAFVSDEGGDFDLYIINSDGTGLFPLTNNPVNDTLPSISGNGGKIAFQSEQGSDSDIYIINSDGTGQVQLTQNTAEDVEPSISADGLWVAYVSTDDPFGTNPEKDEEIFLVKNDKSIRRQLTRNSYPDRGPSISSDGSKIAFQSRVGAFFGIWIVNFDGTGLSPVTTGEGDNISPSISADGGRIAFNFCGPATESIPPVPDAIQPSQDFQCPPIPFEVMVINSDGSGLRQLSSTGGDNFSPAISGDGNRVAYVSTGDGDREVIRVNTDSSGQVQITNNMVFDIEPSIDRTGSTVVFLSNEDGDFELFVYRLDSANLQRQFELDWSDFDNSGIVDVNDVANAAIMFDQPSLYWDLNLNGITDINDVALVGFYFDQQLALPYPGQGYSPGMMDSGWNGLCNDLPEPLRTYCATRL